MDCAHKLYKKWMRLIKLFVYFRRQCSKLIFMQLLLSQTDCKTLARLSNQVWKSHFRNLAKWQIYVQWCFSSLFDGIEAPKMDLVYPWGEHILSKRKTMPDLSKTIYFSSNLKTIRKKKWEYEASLLATNYMLHISFKFLEKMPTRTDKLIRKCTL